MRSNEPIEGIDYIETGQKPPQSPSQPAQESEPGRDDTVERMKAEEQARVQKFIDYPVSYPSVPETATPQEKTQAMSADAVKLREAERKELPPEQSPHTIDWWLSAIQSAGANGKTIAEVYESNFKTPIPKSAQEKAKSLGYDKPKATEILPESFLIYDYDQNKFVEVDKPTFIEREEYYKEHPKVGPDKMTPDEYDKWFKENYTQVGIEHYIKNDDLDSLKKESPELYKELTRYGYKAYEKALAKKSEEIGKQNGEVKAERERFEHDYVILPDDTMIPKNEWEGLRPEQQDLAQRKGGRVLLEAIKQEQEQFELTHTPVGENQWVANTELLKIKTQSPELYKLYESKGYEATFGVLEKAGNDPKAQFNTMKELGLIPKNSIMTGTRPDGSFTYIPLVNPADGKLQAAKQAGLFVAETLLPGVWLKDIKGMPAWQIALNTGLDLLILVPVAGWTARAAGKTILKAGTTTIAKSLAKELPKALSKAGEKALAQESKVIAKEVRSLDKFVDGVEKASVGVAKAEKAGNVDSFVKAVKFENDAKRALSEKMRDVGVRIAVLDSKLPDSVKLVGRESIGKARGLVDKAVDFADYIAGSQREISRAQYTKSLKEAFSIAGKSTKSDLVNAIRAYAGIPQTIKEASIASAKTMRGGVKEGAKYLSGTTTDALKLGKLKAPTNPKELEANLTKLKKAVETERARGRERLAKYKGKFTMLDKWDDFIRESYSPRMGGQGRLAPPVRQKPLSPSGGGGVGVATRETASVQSGEYRIANTYQFPIRTLGGLRVFTVVVNTDTGTTEVVYSPEVVTMPDILIEEDGKFTPLRQEVVTKPKPETKPETKPDTEPGPEPKPIIIHYIAKPKPLQVATVAPFIETPSVETEAKRGVKVTPATRVEKAGEPSPQPSISPAVKTATRVTTKTITGTETKLQTKPATKPITQPVTKPATKKETRLVTEPMTRMVTKIATEPATKPQTKPVIKPAIKTTIKTPTKIPPPIKLSGGLSERDKRRLVKESKGAITWRQGELSGRDVWHVILSPYSRKQYFIVTGKKPVGATVVRGVGSAYKTVKMFGGKLSRRLTVDLGAQDVGLEPISGSKGVRISFKPDKRLSTTSELVSKRPGQIGTTRKVFPLR